MAREVLDGDEYTARLEPVESVEVRPRVSGYLEAINLVTEGNLVTGGLGTQGTLLTTIVQLDPLYAYFEADERSYLKYMHLAQSGERPTSREFHHPVWIGVADEEGFPREGLMDFVDNQLDRGTGTMVGRALVSNPDLLLSPGLFARLRLPGSGQYGAVVVPDEAIGNDQAKKFVWVIDAGNKAQLRNVETGPLLHGARVIRDGLTRQDWVVVAGMQRVRAGGVVDPQRVDNAHLAPKNAPAAPAKDTPSTESALRRSLRPWRPVLDAEHRASLCCTQPVPGGPRLRPLLYGGEARQGKATAA